MKRLSYRSYALLGACLILSFAMPRQWAMALRSTGVAACRPLWIGSSISQQFLFAGPCGQMHSDEDYGQLQIENDHLRSQINRMMQWLEQQGHIDGLAQKPCNDEKGKHVVNELIQTTSNFASARVIFREPSSWSQFFWIDVGRETNKKLGTDLVCKNSPVVIGSALIGVVESVGQSRSCVRLITDGSVSPSVRAMRGGLQSQVLIDSIDHILLQLPLHKSDAVEIDSLMQQLKITRNKLADVGEVRYGAKGYLQGSNAPLWRCRNQKLKGYGFQWAFADSEGPAREIGSGKVLALYDKADPISLIKIGDVLVTTGFDGVFPPHLQVATVSRVYPLVQGEPTYSLEADMIASNVHDLEFVQVLPPVRLE